MNYIWAFAMLISVICAVITGRADVFSAAVLDGATEAVSLIISLIGMMAFWTGLMKIAELSGLTEALSKLFNPVFRVLFKDLYPKNLQQDGVLRESPAVEAISMNVTANLLGLGNAATPFGIKAISEMQKLNPDKATATNSMIMFIVLNSASLQLVPTTVMFLRQKYGSANPAEIIPIMWLTSLISLSFGVLLTKIFEKLSEFKGFYKSSYIPKNRVLREKKY